MRVVLVTAAVVLAGAVLTGAAASPAAAAESLAIMPFHLENLALNDAARLEAAVRAGAARAGYDVQAEATTTQLLEASQSLGLDCDVTSAGCAAKVGKIADVQVLLVTHAVGGLDGHLGLDVQLVDVKKGVEVRRASGLLPRDPDAQGAALEAFTAALFSSQPLGALKVQVDPDGAEVAVDGTVRGKAPLADDVGDLVSGDHYVMVKKPGYLPYRTRIEVKPGKVETVVVNLPMDPNAPHEGVGAVPLIVAGSGGALVVAGAIVAVVGFLPYSEFQGGVDKVNSVDAVHKAQLAPGDVSTIVDGHKAAEAGAAAWNEWGRVTFVSGLVGAGVGAVVAAAGGVWALLAAPDETTPPKPRP